MLLVMAALAGIGLMIKYVLPSGREKILRSGINYNQSFWGLDRHQWGDVHLLLAVVLIALLVLHIALHWSCVLTMVRCRITSDRIRRALWTAVALLTLFLLLFPFLFDSSRLENRSFMRRHHQGMIGYTVHP